MYLRQPFDLLAVSAGYGVGPRAGPHPVGRVPRTPAVRAQAVAMDLGGIKSAGPMPSRRFPVRPRMSWLRQALLPAGITLCNLIARVADLCWRPERPKLPSRPRLGPNSRANVEQTRAGTGPNKKTWGGHNPRSVRVRRQGLEPRTRGLRVRCSGILFIQSTSAFRLTRWRDIRNRPRGSAVRCRMLPRSTETSERTWSTHRNRKV